ncbi:MAG: mannose-6-phosphate isomerase [Bacteroidetes bacterium]|nr:mannose-6-phosphate isomerase [Bacteroidota bacterium]
MLYPLKFKPVFKEKIWGGNRIQNKLGLDFSPLPNCGEAWALSGVSECQTVVANGFLAGNDLNEILEIYMDELVGEKVYEKHKNEFPVLVKFIDANDWLSIQVHPNDELAARRRIGNGKTEMWYILDADQGAELITGFNREMEKETYLKFVKENRLKEILNFEEVKCGDVYFIPAGRIHALGPGILLAEIQQTSDTTYRIYDWDRVDSSGNPRDLHTQLALDAIDFTTHDSYRTSYNPIVNRVTPVVNSRYFTTNILIFNKTTEKDYSDLDSFVIYICVEGDVVITTEQGNCQFAKGEIILLPAVTEMVSLTTSTESKILEVYIS